MKSRAIVLCPVSATPADLLQPIAGVPALLRLLLCAPRAGIGEILLLGVNRYPRSVQISVTGDLRLTARLLCLEDQPWSALVQAYPDLEKAWWEKETCGSCLAAESSTRRCYARLSSEREPARLPSSIPNPGCLPHLSCLS